LESDIDGIAVLTDVKTNHLPNFHDTQHNIKSYCFLSRRTKIFPFVSMKRDLILSEEQELRAFENKVCKKMYRAREGELIVQFRVGA
jgi:hypothetical protein